MRRSWIPLAVLVAAVALALPAVAMARMHVYRLPNEAHKLHMTGHRIEVYSRKALRRDFSLARDGILLFCGTRGFRHGQCDALVTTKRGASWCGNTYARSVSRARIRVRVVMKHEGCGDF